MGIVYRAWDPLLVRVVALKIIRAPTPVDDLTTSVETSVRRFLRETRTMSRLSHPHIVRVHEVGSEGGTHWLTMDYVEGANFASLLHPERVDAYAETQTQRTKRDPLPLCRALEILRDVARGVAYAHAQGVLHRDLKPGNVLVDSDGKAYVTDFGLARDLSCAEMSLLTESGALLGTPQYMSPEQAEGRAKDVTTASDVFSMGTMMYEALTGRLPFTALTVADVLRNISKADPVPPTSIRPDVPHDAESASSAWRRTPRVDTRGWSPSWRTWRPSLPGSRSRPSRPRSGGGPSVPPAGIRGCSARRLSRRSSPWWP